jgi:hypothetical protein
MVMAVDNIRHFSKKTKKSVREWVKNNFPSDPGDSFALGIPLSVTHKRDTASDEGLILKGGTGFEQSESAMERQKRSVEKG